MHDSGARLVQLVDTHSQDGTAGSNTESLQSVLASCPPTLHSGIVESICRCGPQPDVQLVLLLIVLSETLLKAS
jgi:hypothetical protein